MIRLLLTASALVLAPAAALAAQPHATIAARTSVTQMDHLSIESVGSGPAVVLIPGLGSPREVYRPFVADLARGHRVLLVQLNGFGGSAPGANAQGNILPGAVADISRYLQQNHIASAHVVGHSMGGVIAMMMARDHQAQVRGVMVIDSLPFIGTMFQHGSVEEMRPIAEQMKTMLATGVAQRGPASADDPNIANMSNTPAGRLQVSQWSRQSDSGVFAEAMYEDATTDLRPDLAAIARVPVRVLYAARADMAAGAQALFGSGYGPAPSIRLIPVPDSLHFIMLDQPDRFRTELNAFLADR